MLTILIAYLGYKHVNSDLETVAMVGLGCALLESITAFTLIMLGNQL